MASCTRHFWASRTVPRRPLPFRLAMIRLLLTPNQNLSRKPKWCLSYLSAVWAFTPPRTFRAAKVASLLAGSRARICTARACGWLSLRLARREYCSRGHGIKKGSCVKLPCTPRLDKPLYYLHSIPAPRGRSSCCIFRTQARRAQPLSNIYKTFPCFPPTLPFPYPNTLHTVR